LHGMKKAAATGADKPGKVNEQELTRDTILEATGVHFETVAPHPAFPLPLEKLEWFMRCRNKDEITKAPYLNAAWKEKDGEIWLESLAVGDTIDWIEIAYGEERATESLDLDYSQFDDTSFQAEFNRRFPLVLGRIKEYEKTVTEISKEKGLHLQIRRTGSRGMLVFTVAARVDSRKNASSQSLAASINKCISALKEAYEAIPKL
jgi:hypothetical protein